MKMHRHHQSGALVEKKNVFNQFRVLMTMNPVG